MIQNWDEVSDDLLGNLFSRIGAGLVRRRDRRRDRRLPLGLVPRLPRHRAARPRRARARARLRDRPDRLPALGRRRLRRAPGTGPGRCPIPTAPCRRPRRSTRPPSTRRWRWALVAYVLWRLRDRLTGGLLFALYLVLAGARALPGRVHPPQRGRRARPHPGAADQRGDDPRRRHLARGRAARPRAACPAPRRADASGRAAAGRRRAGSPSRSGRRRARSRRRRRGRRTPRGCRGARPARCSRALLARPPRSSRAAAPSRSVANRPVATVLTVMPSPATSPARVLNRPTRRHPVGVRERQPGDRLAHRGRGDVDDPPPAALAHPGQRPPRPARAAPAPASV